MFIIERVSSKRGSIIQKICDPRGVETWSDWHKNMINNCAITEKKLLNSSAHDEQVNQPAGTREPATQ